jgi:hypothetical protein
MVAQIDEQQAAMVALAMHPAGQPDGLANMRGALRAAGVGAVEMHSRLVELPPDNAIAMPGCQAMATFE